MAPAFLSSLNTKWQSYRFSSMNYNLFSSAKNELYRLDISIDRFIILCLGYIYRWVKCKDIQGQISGFKGIWCIYKPQRPKSVQQNGCFLQQYEQRILPIKFKIRTKISGHHIYGHMGYEFDIFSDMAQKVTGLQKCINYCSLIYINEVYVDFMVEACNLSPKLW